MNMTYIFDSEIILLLLLIVPSISLKYETMYFCEVPVDHDLGPLPPKGKQFAVHVISESVSQPASHTPNHLSLISHDIGTNSGSPVPMVKIMYRNQPADLENTANEFTSCATVHQNTLELQ